MPENEDELHYAKHEDEPEGLREIDPAYWEDMKRIMDGEQGNSN